MLDRKVIITLMQRNQVLSLRRRGETRYQWMQKLISLWKMMRHQSIFHFCNWMNWTQHLSLINHRRNLARLEELYHLLALEQEQQDQVKLEVKREKQVLIVHLWLRTTRDKLLYNQVRIITLIWYPHQFHKIFQMWGRVRKFLLKNHQFQVRKTHRDTYQGSIQISRKNHWQPHLWMLMRSKESPLVK